MQLGRMACLCLGAALVAAACGGKSHSDPPGSGGSGGSASGGSGGSGTGGSAIGGSGGSGTGGGGGSPPQWQSDVKTLCDQMSKIPCGMPAAECTAELEEGLKDAQILGCGPSYELLVHCAAEHPLSCEPGQNEPGLPPACEPLLDAVVECLGGGEECGAFGGMGTCGISCTSWSAECHEDGAAGMLMCKCTDGPMAGAGFSVPGTCGATWQAEAEAQCAP